MKFITIILLSLLVSMSLLGAGDENAQQGTEERKCLEDPEPELEEGEIREDPDNPSDAGTEETVDLLTQEINALKKKIAAAQKKLSALRNQVTIAERRFKNHVSDQETLPEQQRNIQRELETRRVASQEEAEQELARLSQESATLRQRAFDLPGIIAGAQAELRQAQANLQTIAPQIEAEIAVDEKQLKELIKLRAAQKAQACEQLCGSNEEKAAQEKAAIEAQREELRKIQQKRYEAQQHTQSRDAMLVQAAKRDPVNAILVLIFCCLAASYLMI